MHNESIETIPETPTLRELLRDELAASATELRTLKRWWRTPPDERSAAPPTRSGLSLPCAKLRATLLHLALAHTRGRLHLRTWRVRDVAVATLAEQAALLGAELERLDKLLVSTPALDEAWRARLKVMLGR